MEDARGEIFCTVILRIEPRPYPLGPRRCKRHALTRASPEQRNSSLRRGTIFWLYEEEIHRFAAVRYFGSMKKLSWARVVRWIRVGETTFRGIRVPPRHS